MTSGAAPLLEVDLGSGVRAAFTRRFAEPAPGQEAPVPAASSRRGFNLSLVVGDDDADVLARRALLEGWAGAPVAYVRQVHGAVAHVSGGPPDPALRAAPVAAADALVTATGGVALAVLVADCVPVLLADPDARVVAAVHAGRRGLAAGVVQEAVTAMVRLGAVPRRMRAVVGPAICGDCYEVPAPLRSLVAAAVPGTASTTSWGTPALDLPAGVVAVLEACGVDGVEQVAVCTFTDAGWFSHRASQRSGRPQGRSAGAVSLAP